MISWMQKHKKWLIVTIWISTIAFVGAGFVGWGAYQYGAKAGSVAIVGDIKIDIKEFEQRYSNLYSYYAQIFKEEFDQKKAKEIGLEKEALNSLITEALLLNLAKDFGLIVLDEEMQEKIINTKEFQNNGVFDKKLYIEVLKRAGMKPKDFENSIKKEILLSKLHDILKPVLTPLEFESFGASLFMADKIKYKVLTKNDVDIKYTQDELKKFWQDHKNNYLTEPMYEISIVWVEPKDYNISKDELIKFYEENKIKFKKSNGKIKSFEEAKAEVKDLLTLRKRKKEALKKYIEFKKGKIKESTKLTLSIKNSAIPSNIMEEISQKNENSYLKPKLIDKKYAIIRLDKKIASRPKSFEDAKDEVLRDFLNQKTKEKLVELANKMYNKFDGNITDYISRDDVDKLSPLKEIEAAQFLNKLFGSDKEKGYIIVEDGKVVLYNILDQKLVQKSKLDKNRAFITDNSIKVKETLLNSTILDTLQKSYDIEIFYKGQ